MTKIAVIVFFLGVLFALANRRMIRKKRLKKLDDLWAKFISLNPSEDELTWTLSDNKAFRERAASEILSRPILKKYSLCCVIVYAKDKYLCDEAWQRLVEKDLFATDLLFIIEESKWQDIKTGAGTYFLNWMEEMEQTDFFDKNPVAKHCWLRTIIENVESLRIQVAEKLIALNPSEKDLKCIKKYVKRHIGKAETNSKLIILEKAKEI